MKIEFTETNHKGMVGTYILLIFGRVDFYTSNYIKSKFLKSIKEYNVKRVVFDMKNTTAVALAGIGTILFIINYCGANHIDICFSNVRQNVIDIFKISELDKKISIYKTLKLAIESFKSK